VHISEQHHIAPPVYDDPNKAIVCLRKAANHAALHGLLQQKEKAMASGIEPRRSPTYGLTSLGAVDWALHGV
jgi:hypothetical protein